MGLPAPAEIQQGAAVVQLKVPGASAAPPSASNRSFIGPQNAPVGRVASPPSSDSMLGLGRLSATNGSVHGHWREVHEDDVRVLNEEMACFWCK